MAITTSKDTANRVKIVPVSPRFKISIIELPEQGRFEVALLDRGKVINSPRFPVTPASTLAEADSIADRWTNELNALIREFSIGGFTVEYVSVYGNESVFKVSDGRATFKIVSDGTSVSISTLQTPPDFMWYEDAKPADIDRQKQYLDDLIAVMEEVKSVARGG